ncbi:MAG: 4Fe-4S binding protein, partial [Candidatus Weimeria sp.]
MKKSKLSTRTRKAALRGVIQLIFFILFTPVFSTAFAGVKYIFTQIGAHKLIEMTSFVEVLIAVLIFTIIFGRFFCGYACAFGAFGDLLHGIYVFFCKKLKIKQIRFPEKLSECLSWIKYVILAAIAVLCFSGLYDRFNGSSPWEVFSTAVSGKIVTDGYTAAWIILALIMVG